jgi:acetyl esterase/lipase
MSTVPESESPETDFAIPLDPTRHRPGLAMRAGFLALSLLAVACSPLTAFNTLMPKDAGGLLAARGLNYGPDPRQHLDIYGPRDAAAPAHRYPVIVFFYGGSWNSGSRSGYAWLGRALAARGFVVAVPDYRLVPHVRFPEFLRDSALAVRFVREVATRYGGDPDRVVLAGHSAGAYNAAMLALDPQWLGDDRKAIRGLIGLAGPYDFLPLDGPVVEAAFGQAPDPALTQPVHFAGTDAPPAFLGTGDKDDTVRPANSDSLAARLRGAGVAVERHAYAHVGHVGLVTAIAKPFRGKASVLDDMATFASRVTGGK